MDFLVNKPNHVVQKQRFFQGLNGKELVFLRGGRSKLYFSAYMTMFSVGLAGSLYTLVQYGLGNAKKSAEE